MIDAVLVFGGLNILFEFILLSMLPPRMRLRLLGSDSKYLLHFAFLLINLILHWGTLIGTMSGIMAFVASMTTVAFAEKLFGKVVGDRYYTVGWIKYSVKELK